MRGDEEETRCVHFPQRILLRYSNNFIVDIGFRLNETTTADHIGGLLALSVRETQCEAKNQVDDQHHLLRLGHVDREVCLREE